MAPNAIRNSVGILAVAGLFTFIPSILASETCSVSVTEKGIVLKGIATVEDGDTIWVGIHKVRLYGIEALEHDQPCWKEGKRLKCSERSITALTERIKGKTLKCHIDRGKYGRPLMSYNRYLGTCFLDDGSELNRWLVRQGWALAEPTARGKIYEEAESQAAREKLGIHIAQFDRPKDFRRSKNGAYKSCPKEYQCVRSNRTDIEELLSTFEKAPSD